MMVTVIAEKESFMANLENRVAAAEQHIRDLEASRDALAEDMRKRDLAARVAKLETDGTAFETVIRLLETAVARLYALTGQGRP